MILITGATSGIGLELARFYDKQNKKLLLIGRKERPSDPIFKKNLYCKADLSKANSIKIIENFIKRKSIKLNIIVHNAAVACYGKIQEQDDKKIEALIRTNLISPILLTKRLIPYLSKNGTIVFIGSTISFIPSLNLAVYAATKGGLSNFTKNLRLDLKNKFNVICIHPGGTKTALHTKREAPKRRYSLKLMDPKKVAEEIMKAIKKRKPETIIGFRNNLMIKAYDIFPGVIEKLLLLNNKE